MTALNAFVTAYATGIGTLASIVIQAIHHLRRLRAERELARLTAPLPPDRINLTGWPQRLTPSDLPGIGHTDALAAVELSSRATWRPAKPGETPGQMVPEALFVPAPPPLVVGLAVVEGRHHIGVAPGTDSQRARWDSPTGQFWAIVDDLGDLWEPCSHCAAPEDGEPAHAACPGCSCPCRLVEAAPAAEVDLQALRGRAPLFTVAEVDDEFYASVTS